MSNRNQNTIIQMQDVVKAYSTGEGLFAAVNHVTMAVKQGEFLGITGKSGAGKTTLLNLIAGVSRLTSGSILFHWVGEESSSPPLPIHTLDEDKLALWRGEHIGIVYQSFELMPSLSLVENVMLPPDFSGHYHPLVTKKRALELLELVEVAEHAYKIPAHISGGQKQRVAIARALVNDPHLIIADEPTGNLDSVTAETILQIFETLVQQGKTIVMVTHDESFASRFSRRLRIVDGVVSDPAAADAGPAPGSEATAAHENAFLPAAASPIEVVSSSPRRVQHGAGPEAPINVSARPDSAAVTSKSPWRLLRFGILPHARNDIVGGESLSSQQGQTEASPAIVLRNVEKVYVNAAGRFVALKSIDMQLAYGQFISIVGKSGCGKSTLLNMITGIDHPTAGDVIIGDEYIYRMSESKRALWRGRNLGVVFQFFQLLPTLTLLENTMLPMDYCNLYPFSERPTRAMELLKTVGLEDQAHKLPTAVSAGQQQSAAIARALATDPSIILADEPTGNLDSRSADNVLTLFETLVKRGKTILIVTHDPSITQRTDQTIILSDGEIIDQTVARVLPFLSHPQMLVATKQAQRQKVAPRATILQQGAPIEHFFMIVSGEVDIVARNKQQKEIQLARLGPGHFFGEVELIQGGHLIASVQGADSGAELALLPRETFFELIDGSPLARHAMHEVAATRLAENIRWKTGQ